MSGDGNKNRLLAQFAIVVAALFLLSYLPGPSQRTPPGPPLLSWAFLSSNPILLLPLLALAGIGGVWWVVDREPLNKSVTVQYSPPPDLSPAEASALLEDSLRARAIVATVVDLAVRGYLSIEPAAGAGEHAGKEDYLFRNLRRHNWANELAPHELGLMEHIFEYGEQPSLATLWHGLPDYLPQINNRVFASLAAKKMYRVNPIWSGTVVTFGGFVVFLFLWLLAKIFNVKLTDHDVLNPVCFVLSMAILFFISRRITLKSTLGAERWRHVKGFQEFMGRVEAERMRSISPDLFEKFLPYAIALGVERAWTTHLKGMLTRPLSWYAGTFAEFVSAFDD